MEYGYKHLAHLVKRFKTAFCYGFVEFCNRGCIVGTQYLVQRNYHWSERLIWSIIFLGFFSRGFIFMQSYLENYSENVYRVVYEDHERSDGFKFPSVGVCEINSPSLLEKVDAVLNRSVYMQYPNLNVHHDKLRNFVNIMSFQTLHSGNAIRSFRNYTETLDYYTRSILKSLDYKMLMEQIRSPCKEFFTSCVWEEEEFDCCQYFLEIPTMLGKCFILNSLLNSSNVVTKLAENIPTYAEPHLMLLTFNNPAQIFLLNQRDIPETLTPMLKYSVVEENTRLHVEFTIVPTIMDRSLDSLHSNITKCTVTKMEGAKGNITYIYRSYTTCIYDCFVIVQWETCGCINILSVKPYAPFCNFTQYACLEENGFINAHSMVYTKFPFCRHCIQNCDDSDFVVESLYYETNNLTIGKRAIMLALLNSPTKHKKRQAIRQEEDKLVSISGILCLFLGANVVTIIEFLYLFCRAFARRHLPTLPHPTPRGGYGQGVGNVPRKAIKLSPHKP